MFNNHLYKYNAKDTRRRGEKETLYTRWYETPSQGQKTLNLASVVHLAHVDDLLAECVSDLLGVTLAHNGLVGGLDRVHGVS
jgi:hypothetical protein